MLEPKNTLVPLAGQKAWHICVGEAAPRISGKYFPSQLRTQKPGPELATRGRGGGVGCGLLLRLLLKILVKNELKSGKPSAELRSGASATGPMMAAATSRRCSLR